MTFKKNYKKKFKKTFTAWNPVFTPQEYLKLKASLDTNLGRKISECIDPDFDLVTTEEQQQINKDLTEKWGVK